MAILAFDFFCFPILEFLLLLLLVLVFFLRDTQIDGCHPNKKKATKNNKLTKKKLTLNSALTFLHATRKKKMKKKTANFGQTRKHVII